MRRVCTGTLMPQTIGQCRIALPIHDPIDGQPNGLGWSHQDGQLLGTREASIQKISTQKNIVLHDYVG